MPSCVEYRADIFECPTCVTITGESLPFVWRGSNDGSFVADVPVGSEVRKGVPDLSDPGEEEERQEGKEKGRHDGSHRADTPGINFFLHWARSDIGCCWIGRPLGVETKQVVFIAHPPWRGVAITFVAALGAEIVDMMSILCVGRESTHSIQYFS